MSYNDLRSIPKMRNKTVMAIKAPPNTQLSVPTWDEGSGSARYSIQMKSSDGPIEVSSLLTWFNTIVERV